MKHNKLYHYTNINTFALIFKYRTIRFNRLDMVDDISEGESFSPLNLQQFFFISCWTYDQNESLPQWNMYTKDMAGVRVAMKSKIFDYNPLIVPEEVRNKGLVQKGEVLSPIPFEKMFGDSYLIFPAFIQPEYFEREVEYENDFINMKNEAIKIEHGQINGPGIIIKEPTRIASIKSPDWSFQKEFRFVLFILPNQHIVKDAFFFKNLTQKFPAIARDSLLKGEGPAIKYFDVDIDQESIDTIEVTVGPLCTEGDYIIIKSLVDQYAPKGKIIESKFKGTIRKNRI